MTEKRKRYTQTTDYMRMLRRMLAAAGERVGEADVEDLVELAAIRDDLDEAIRKGIVGLREDGYTWQSIGEAFGVTRQAALMKWGRKPVTVVAESDKPKRRRRTKA